MHLSKQELKEKLVARHQSFLAQIDGLSQSEFEATKNGKWSAGQQLAHIWLSVNPLVRLLASENSLLERGFGTLSREPMDYTELSTFYNTTLLKGGRATNPFAPEAVSFDQKPGLMANIETGVAQLAENLAAFDDGFLDSQTIPHPLLGPLSVREMGYFTLYHVKHHQKQLP